MVTMAVKDLDKLDSLQEDQDLMVGLDSDFLEVKTKGILEDLVKIHLEIQDLEVGKTGITKVKEDFLQDLTLVMEVVRTIRCLQDGAKTNLIKVDMIIKVLVGRALEASMEVLEANKEVLEAKWEVLEIIVIQVMVKDTILGLDQEKVVLEQVKVEDLEEEEVA